MIRQEVPGVNPDKYIYKTELDFAKDFSKKLLDTINVSDSVLELRKKYIHPRTQLEEIKNHPDLQDMERGKKFFRRCLQIKKKYQDQQPIDFKQYFMSPDLTAEFYNLVPSWLKEIKPVTIDDNSKSYGNIPEWLRKIVPGEPIPNIQISQLGDFLAPHKGHPRKSSLFMLLQGNKEETRWYRETEPFEVFDYFRVPDLDKIEHVATAEIEPFHWYVFNHEEWHSVHRFGNGKRINIGIDFDSISAPDLIELIKKRS